MTPRNGSSAEGAPVVLLELALARGLQAPAAARAAIAHAAGGLELDGSSRQTLLLLVSEVVSNAVLHSTGPAEASIDLSVAIVDDAVRVAVTDAGEGFVPVDRDPERVEGGYGLYLLAKAASRWGVDASGSTSVWFELPLGAPALGL